MKIRPFLVLFLILVIFLGTAGIQGGSRTLAGSFDSFTLPADKPLFQILEPTGEKPIKGFPVLRVAQPSSPVVQNNTELLTSSFAAQAVKLHWYAKNYLIRQLSENGQIGRKAWQKREWLDQPTYMGTGMVGGWALDGLWLREDSRLKDMTGVPYEDPGNWRGRSFEALFSHELGHVILHQLSGKTGTNLATLVHETPIRTDNWVAFDEGLGHRLSNLWPRIIRHSRSSRGIRLRPPMPRWPGWSGDIQLNCNFPGAGSVLPDPPL